MESRSVKDEELFENLVSTHQTALLRLCYTLLLDRSLAEEAVQDTFLRVWKHLDRIRDEDRYKAWIFQIAVNRCRDIRRSAWFRHRLSQKELPENRPDPASGVSEEDMALNIAIQQLPFKQKEVILLYFYQRFTLEEIADMLGISHASVSERKQRGLEALKKELKGETENE